MEYLQYMLCMKCYEGLAGKGNVLMCSGCGLWQHTKCAGKNGDPVSPDFYLQFYLAVTLGEKPRQWCCDYCSSHKPEEKQEDNCSTKQKLPPLCMPPKPSMHNLSDDSSSDDELTANFDINRSGREGVASNIHSNIKRSEKTGVTLIPFQKIFLDNSPTPVSYTLRKEPSGCKVIVDSQDNKLQPTGMIKSKVETYECAQEDCKFQVRVCVSMMQFLRGYGDEKHSHYNEPLRLRIARRQHNWTVQPTNDRKSATSEDSDTDSDLSSLSPPVLTPQVLSPSVLTPQILSPPVLTPYNTPEKQKSPNTGVQQESAWPSSSSDSSDSDDDIMSPILPYNKNNRKQTNVISKIVSGRSMSYCSGTTDGSDTEVTETPAIQRFVPLTTSKITPKINKSAANFSFSSSSDSSDDDLNITHLCDQLSKDSDTDSGRVSGDSDIPPPSPTDTIPACHSDDSNDVVTEAVPDDTPTVFTVTEGTASGGRTKLTDNQGYTYQIKFKLGMRIFWTCTEKPSRCSATVIQQRKSQFVKGAASHNHLPNQSETTVNSSKPVHQETVNHSDQRITQKEADKDHVISNSTETVSTTSENLLPSRNCATVNQSKTAKIVTGVRKEKISSTQKVNKDKDSAKFNTDKEPAQTMRSLNVSSVVYEEVMSTERFMCRIKDSMKPYSVLVNSEGYVFNRRCEDDTNQLTTWTCIKKGSDGKQCQASVRVDYDPNFNMDYEDFIWVKEHQHCILTIPHNHAPDETEANLFKLKAYIHQQVFGICTSNISARDIIRQAKSSMKISDTQESALLSHISSLLCFVYKQRKLNQQNRSNVLDKFKHSARK